MESPITVLLLFILTCGPAVNTLSTADRIKEHGYPVETHRVQTKDGYMLTMFRIPRPFKSPTTTNRTVVLLMHGLLSSSDCWILSGPGVALPYKLVDAGYDVWLGNNRGNTYSRRHVQFSQHCQQFWNFDWHQFGVFDLPATIDYILSQTKQTSLHYIGHSQGTTIFLVMASTLPKYNSKIKSAHMLSPVGYMSHMRGPIVGILSSILGVPGAFNIIVENRSVMVDEFPFSAAKKIACELDTAQELFCSNLLFLVGGWNRDGMNMTILSDVLATHPAGASINQLLHYSQEYLSGKFGQYDYGFTRNLLKYKRLTPPKYNLRRITAPLFLYYANNDYMSDPRDVRRLMDDLPKTPYSFNLPDPNWNHFDFLWAKNVDKILFDKVIANIQNNE